jgi:DDE family transposase
VRIADRQFEGVACIRLDATVVTAHSDKELAQANFTGYGHHPLLAACDNTGEPLAWMLRPGSAGSNTAADHLRLPREAIAALPPALRRKIMVTCDGAGAGPGLVTELDRLAARHGYQVTWSAGWALGGREQGALGNIPRPPGKPPSTPGGRSVSGAPKMPAAARAAPTRPAGSKKRMSPS